MPLERLLSDYGLAAIFIGVMVEGDVTLLLAGVGLHLGVFRLLPTLGVATAGMLLIDAAIFVAGRRSATRARATAAYRRAAPAIERVVGRAGPFQILLARAIWGTRIATMLFWGIRGLPPWHFLALDTVGCALWAGLLIAVGHHVSDGATVLVGEVKAIERWLAVGLGSAILVVVTAHLIARRKRIQAPAPPPPS